MKKLFTILLLLMLLPSQVFAYGVLKQSTATNIVIGPFLDDTDGKTTEDALTVTSFDFDLYKGATKSNITITASGGSNDCVDVANGYYNCELTIGDTDTLGRLRVTVNISGALPVWEDYTVQAQDTAGYSTVTIKDGTGTGEIDTLSGSIVNVDLVDLATTTSTATTATTCGALGTQAKLDVNAEVDTALSDIGLNHLLAASVTGTDITDNSIIAKIVSKSATADWDSYNNTTDSLEATQDTALTASDNIGINWADITNPTSTVALTNTTVGTVTTTTTASTCTSATTCGSVTNPVTITSNADITAILADTAAVDTTTKMRTFLTGSDTAVSTLTTGSTIAGVTTAGTCTTATTCGTCSAIGDKTGYSIADSTSDTVIADAVWNAATATYGSSGSYGEKLESLSAGGGATAQQVWEYAINGCSTANWACTYLKTLYDKRPTNYIMGSSVNTDKDDEIDNTNLLIQRLPR